MLVIRRHQVAALRQPLLRSFEAGMLDHLQRCFPIDCALLNEAALLRVIRCGVKAAIGHGFETQSEVCRFIDLTLTLGHDFLSDPLLPWAADCLASGHPPPVTFQMLHDEALAQMAEMSGDEGQYVMRAVLRARALSFDRASDPQADTPRLLRRLWPQKWRLRDPAQQARFLALAAERAAADGLTTSGGQTIYTVLMLLLGSGFARDPALPWAAAALQAAPADDPQARARHLHAAGMVAIDRFVALLPSRVEA
jgi:hypothetical protein